MKKLVVALIFAFISFSSLAQGSYSTAIGGRLGNLFGFSVRHFATERVSLEGVLGARWNHAGAAFFVNWNFPIPLEGMNWYIGPGVGVGMNYYNRVGFSPRYGGLYRGHQYTRSRPYFNTSVMFQGGVEYSFDFGLNLSFDLSPRLHFTPGYDRSDIVGFDPLGYTSVGVRYILN